MNSFLSILTKKKWANKIDRLYISAILFIVLIGFYFYSQSLIQIETPQFDPGEKIIVTLPDGKTIYTYENLLYEENGKLFYLGENITLDLTGGKIDYKNWD